MWKKSKRNIKKGRTINTTVNFIIGVLDKFITLALSFISRTIFIKTLGAEYLGVNGLFTNILSVLSLAELGIENAIIFKLYRPIKDNDQEEISSLITYYKKIYRKIAIVVLAFGLAVIPFLKYIVNVENDVGNIYIYYIMFLGNSALSYLYIYRTAILKADQKEYKLKTINIIMSISQFIFQTIILLILKNYYLYLAIKIITSIFNNIICSEKAKKDYPYIEIEKEINVEEKKSIWGNVKDMFLYQLGSVMLNNTDNILISMILGTSVVGIYSNYEMIITAITGFTSMFFTAAQASVGNLVTEKNTKKNIEVFNALSLMSFWIYGFCSICFAVLMQDFIYIWLGREYQLPMMVLLVCIFNYYIKGIIYPVWNFRFTTGLFKYTKHIMFVASAINIILSIILGIYFGLFGIFIATAISRLLTNVWYEPYKLFKIYFKQKVYKYYLKQILDFIIVIIVGLITYYCSNIVNFSNIYMLFFSKIIICLFLPNLLFYLIKSKTSEFKFVVKKLKGIFLKN